MPELPSSADLLRTAEEAARRAGAIIRANYDQPRVIREKAPRDLVTDTDIEAQAAALAVIGAAYPDHPVLAEESPAGFMNEEGLWVFPDGILWVVDPLDGTTNYANAIPISCVSIGVVINGQPAIGVIYDPYREELFAASLGGGATLNGKPLATLAPVPLERAVVGVDWARHPQVRFRVLTTVDKLAPLCQTVRALGSAALALAYVACGRLQLYFNYGLQPWDVAAGAVLIHEAGGQIRPPGRDDWHFGEPSILAAHPDVLDQVQPLVKATEQ